MTSSMDVKPLSTFSAPSILRVVIPFSMALFFIVEESEVLSVSVRMSSSTRSISNIPVLPLYPVSRHSGHPRALNSLPPGMSLLFIPIRISSSSRGIYGPYSGCKEI